MATSLEICDHTGLRKSYCSHCNPAIVPEPHYELRPSSYRGNPVVEVLKDGGPVHPYDEHFRFGREKAKLIVAAMDLIEEFASNSIVESREVQSKRFGLRFRAWVEMHDEFVHSSGAPIHRPWLKLEVLPAGTGAEIG